MKNGARRKVAICRATRVVFVYGVALKMVYKFFFLLIFITLFIIFIFKESSRKKDFQ